MTDITELNISHKPYWKISHISQYNIKTDLEYTEWQHLDWIHLNQNKN